jgi:hypothetical protein
MGRLGLGKRLAVDPRPRPAMLDDRTIRSVSVDELSLARTTALPPKVPCSPEYVPGLARRTPNELYMAPLTQRAGAALVVGLGRSECRGRFSGRDPKFRGMTDPPPGDDEGGWLTVIVITLLIVLAGLVLLFVEIQH